MGCLQNATHYGFGNRGCNFFVCFDRFCDVVTADWSWMSGTSLLMEANLSAIVEPKFEDSLVMDRCVADG